MPKHSNGLLTAITINASALMFPGVAPKFSITTGSGPASFTELAVINHPGVNVDGVQRQIGLVFKLSSESTTNESNKMGGLVLETNSEYANQPSLSLLTANVRRLTIGFSGNVGINTTDTKGYRFAVNGGIIANAITVKTYASWPDYVFDRNYRLIPLDALKSYIDRNNHLLEVPSAAEMEKDGINLGQMNHLLMKKVEELTLYLIQKDKENQEQQKQMDNLRELVLSLKSKLEGMEEK